LKFLAPGAPLKLSVPDDVVAPIAEAIELTAEGENEHLIDVELFDSVVSIVEARLKAPLRAFLRTRHFKQLQLQLTTERALNASHQKRKHK
jgi:hypothetical protein